MSIHTRLLLILILLSTPMLGKCGGYASWQQKTIYGSEICNIKGPNGYAKGIKCKEPLSVNIQEPLINNITRWYLYGGYIIGEVIESGEAKFFIFEEAACQNQIIQSKEEFDAMRREKDLVPLIWTRWYKKNWGFILTDGNIADKLDFTFIKVPILFFIGVVTLIGLIKTKFSLRHRFNQVTLTIVGAIIVRIILDLFPNSI